jgi:hypothetical protein
MTASGKRLAAAVTVASLLMLMAGPACAQGGFEIEVYGSEIVPRQSIMLELLGNHIFRAANAATACTATPVVEDDRQAMRSIAAAAAGCVTLPPKFATGRVTGSPSYALAVATMPAGLTGKDSSVQGLPSHASLEITAGLTTWSALGVYLFSTEATGAGTTWSGVSIRPMVRVPRSWHWPIGVALSTELEYERPIGAAATVTWEIRPIFDQTFGRWYFSVNPTLEYPLHGSGGSTSVQFSPSAKMSFDFTPNVSAGIEYYGAYGPIGGFAARSNRLQQFFGAADLHVSPHWEINFGVGVGATPASNQLVAKLIVGRRFSWGKRLPID